MKNNRRNFLKIGLAVGASVSMGNLGELFAEEPSKKSETAAAAGLPQAAKGKEPVLVALRDGSRSAMLDRAFESLGGIAAFVKPGQTVVIKPNIGWDVTPECGANTHPELVGRLVKLCVEAGAKSVSVFDNSCDQWQRAYETSGIGKAAKENGAHIVDGKDESLYREVAIPGGIKLKSAKVHSLVLDSDVFFNVPVLKNHSGSLMTGAMKNLMGVVWDRGCYHRTDLHQMIADFLTLRKPTLNILDAYHPIVRNGPRGKTADDCVEMRTLLVSADPVLIDAAGAKLMGYEIEKVTHIKIAAEMKIGSMNLNTADVRRVKMA